MSGGVACGEFRGPLTENLARRRELESQLADVENDLQLVGSEWPASARMMAGVGGGIVGTTFFLFLYSAQGNPLIGGGILILGSIAGVVVGAILLGIAYAMAQGAAAEEEEALVKERTRLRKELRELKAAPLAHEPSPAPLARPQPALTLVALAF